MDLNEIIEYSVFVRNSMVKLRTQYYLLDSLISNKSNLLYSFMNNNDYQALLYNSHKNKYDKCKSISNLILGLNKFSIAVKHTNDNNLLDDKIISNLTNNYSILKRLYFKLKLFIIIKGTITYIKFLKDVEYFHNDYLDDIVEWSNLLNDESKESIFNVNCTDWLKNE